MADFTTKHGQYLAFIHAYTEGFGFPPAESEIAKAMKVAPPSVNQLAKVNRFPLIETALGKRTKAELIEIVMKMAQKHGTVAGELEDQLRIEKPVDLLVSDVSSAIQRATDFDERKINYSTQAGIGMQPPNARTQAANSRLFTGAEESCSCQRRFGTALRRPTDAVHRHPGRKICCTFVTMPKTAQLPRSHRPTHFPRNAANAKGDFFLGVKFGILNVDRFDLQ